MAADQKSLAAVSQMDSVMERLGLDLNLAARKAGGAAMKEARDICLACPMQRRCREWLDGQTTLGEPNFCPNLIFFEQCGKV